MSSSVDFIFPHKVGKIKQLSTDEVAAGGVFYFHPTRWVKIKTTGGGGEIKYQATSPPPPAIFLVKIKGK